jgi:membrane peptidoglycan carboxypeptidase
MVLRKREELRMSFWVEQQMRERFGSKRRAKEEIFARYASFVYMGNGQYGFARAAEYYFGRPLSTFTADDADKAALLASIAKSPRDYAPNALDRGPILRRRNQTLALMAAQGFISANQMPGTRLRPLPAVVQRPSQPFQSSAVVEHVLDELKAVHADLSVDDLLQGRIQVYSTVNARVQNIASEALEHGLARYEQRHPSARGVVQGSIVVLKNRDGSILAETGGRQVYRGRATGYSDFNRVREALRQPGSTMKPIVYLAAFRRGDFTLETLVPDEPISGAERQRETPEMDCELRRAIQGPHPDPGSARRIEKRGRDLDHGAHWHRRRPADVAQSRCSDATARRERRTISETPSSWARRTASTGSLSACGSVSTTILRSASGKPAGGSRCRCFRN